MIEESIQIPNVIRQRVMLVEPANLEVYEAAAKKTGVVLDIVAEPGQVERARVALTDGGYKIDEDLISSMFTVRLGGEDMSAFWAEVNNQVSDISEGVNSATARVIGVGAITATQEAAQSPQK